jgi:hypothetical protein
MTKQEKRALAERGLCPDKIYYGSDGVKTRQLHAALMRRGSLGAVAKHLFAAQTSSERAKHYHGGIRGVGSYRQLAYEQKQTCMNLLTEVLTEHNLGIIWGWKEDPGVVFGDKASVVLYIDLPNRGQVSFHSPTRGVGPDYPRDWDKLPGASVDRIIDFAKDVMKIEAEPEAPPVKVKRVRKTVEMPARTETVSEAA